MDTRVNVNNNREVIKSFSHILTGTSDTHRVDKISEATINIMANTVVDEVVQDHRALAVWSQAAENETDLLPISMRFNEGHKLSIIVYSVLMVVSTVGNVTVLWLLTKRRLRGPSRIDYMLMHLAIADLLVTFLMMPMEIAWAYTVSWEAGDFMCRIMAFFRTFGIYLSSFILVCISIDRYFAVLKPLRISDTRGKVMIATAWISSIFFSTPQAIIFHLETHPNITTYEQCVTYNFFENEFHIVIYSMIGMVMMYALPLVIIIFCYGSIYIEIYKKTKKVITGTERFRRSNDDVLGRAKRRTLKMTITIVIVFVVCWTPFYVMSMWYWFDRESALMVDQRVQKGLFLFASTNSCMNPIVYGIFNIRGRVDKTNNVAKMRFSSGTWSTSTINTRHSSITKRSDSAHLSLDGTNRSSATRTPAAPNSVKRTICMRSVSGPPVTTLMSS